jgi:hypothetical protein
MVRLPCSGWPLRAIQCCALLIVRSFRKRRQRRRCIRSGGQGRRSSTQGTATG